MFILGMCTLVGCSGNNQTKDGKIEYPSSEIKVSHQGVITNKPSSYNFAVRYCGMPNKETFSLSPLSHGAVNYYYPVAATNISFEGSNLEVLSVTPESIKLRKTE